MVWENAFWNIKWKKFPRNGCKCLNTLRECFGRSKQSEKYLFPVSGLAYNGYKVHVFAHFSLSKRLIRNYPCYSEFYMQICMIQTSPPTLVYIIWYPRSGTQISLNMWAKAVTIVKINSCEKNFVGSYWKLLRIFLKFKWIGERQVVGNMFR